MTNVISTPDHPIRRERWWQIFDRLWRPAGGWVLVGGMIYAFLIGPWVLRPMGPGELTLLGTLVAAFWGLKTLEKRQGTA